VLLHINLLFEGDALAHLHKFVRVAGITIFAGKFAAALGIDGPFERHAATAVAAVQHGFRRQREVFNVVAFAQRLAGSGEAGDSYELRLFGQVEQRKGGHVDSPFVRLV
jgi:hypothetical protein